MFFRKNHLDSFFLEEKNQKFDKYQREVIVDQSKYLLVLAGAGSGKTTTIAAKIVYLITRCHVNKDEILCLSFTNKAVINLKEKIPYQVDVLTFHKLALNILEENHLTYGITQDDLLDYVIDEYFHSYLSYKYQRYLREYFDNLSYEEIFESKKFLIFKKNIFSFICKMKCNDLKIKTLKKKIRSVLDNKEKIFLIFTLDIYYFYQEELKSTLKMDFDDMIIYAYHLVKKNGLRRKYRYIIIDEYQDISYIRFKLIREIIRKLDAHLVCVGDDYQAIYGFSGSNLSLFLDFFKYFKGRRLELRNTYRNSYELIKISQKFILKNPYQISKRIYAKFLLKYPIVLVYYDEENYLETYHHLLDYLYLENKKELLVLARYNKDLLEIKDEKHQGMDIDYLTVHMAKGLEKENVLLIKVSDNYLGFPSKINEMDILNILDYSKEEMLYAEERRLFYVALTRCRERIYLLVPRRNPSPFIKEIRNDAVELLLK